MPDPVASDLAVGEALEEAVASGVPPEVEKGVRVDVPMFLVADLQLEEVGEHVLVRAEEADLRRGAAEVERAPGRVGLGRAQARRLRQQRAHEEVDGRPPVDGLLLAGDHAREIAPEVKGAGAVVLEVRAHPAHDLLAEVVRQLAHAARRLEVDGIVVPAVRFVLEHVLGELDEREQRFADGVGVQPERAQPRRLALGPPRVRLGEGERRRDFAEEPRRPLVHVHAAARRPGVDDHPVVHRHGEVAGVAIDPVRPRRG
mmetsp:Transcript_25553/g.79982  ORF Transcript_25553/g.79982 Transcript_25553/m.79982 type:complete len:258 (-) Transcript_25553:84-857(-)